MNIKSAFQSCLTSHPQISSGKFVSESFLGYIFPERNLSDTPLINLLSLSATKALSPWSFDCNPLNCYLLLYTTEGCGKLTINNQVFSLSKDSLLFLDCYQRFRLDVALPPWEYQLAMIEGNPLPYFYKLIPKNTAPIIPVSPCCDIPMTFERLAVWRERNYYHELIISDLINHLLTCFINELLKKPDTPPNASLYLTEIKKLFDEKFNAIYSLDDLEETFGVSKYRLCREFRQAYGLPPFQYLSRKRMEQAAHFLVSTNYRIHEIGSLVGIDNTNHFISQFKKIYKVTPLEYKQRMYP